MSTLSQWPATTTTTTTTRPTPKSSSLDLDPKLINCQTEHQKKNRKIRFDLAKISRLDFVFRLIDWLPAKKNHQKLLFYLFFSRSLLLIWIQKSSMQKIGTKIATIIIIIIILIPLCQFTRWGHHSFHSVLLCLFLLSLLHSISIQFPRMRCGQFENEEAKKKKKSFNCFRNETSLITDWFSSTFRFISGWLDCFDHTQLEDLMNGRSTFYVPSLSTRVSFQFRSIR